MTDNRDPSPAPDLSVRQFTGDLIDAATAGDYDDVAEALAVLARAGSPRVPAGVVGDLVGRCAAAVRGHHGPGADTVFTVVLEDEQGERAEVERLPPGPRAAMRALLAALNHDRPSRDIQVELATRGTPADIVGVLTHLLVWLAELAEPSAAALSCFTD
ncbi:hypothetical protein [Amycolatopsis rifamycinica]|uniref:Uncharacterized protein n=1 Tax=Amycolatopsis rifamycinica TaxID=287986 RepID=A0A066UEF9_9PSEU|nr:hypothetical protein [Amycolatopsis rifamycinica]KDN22593.1 hypothetical protein DV20_08655 [Amycolatopsis rifamycinica]